MANMRDIKQRINATKKTAQITKAMHMVSASKLKRAERSIKQYRPLTDKLEMILSSIFNEDRDLTHPMLEERNIKHTTFVLITSDRGLAGPYNANVFKNFEKHIQLKKLKKSDFSVAALGFKAMSYAKNNGYDIINKEVIQITDDVQFIDFQKISDVFIKNYLSGETDQIVVVFNKFINTISQELILKTLVPLSLNPDVDMKKEEGLNSIYDFEPSPKVTLDSLLPNYVVNMLYGMILEAKASEHAARMTAMKNATDNANDVIHNLTLSFNKARQDAITIELTDIIGGANAVS